MSNLNCKAVSLLNSTGSFFSVLLHDPFEGPAWCSRTAVPAQGTAHLPSRPAAPGIGFTVCGKMGRII